MSRLAVKAAATTRCWRQGSGRGRALYGGYTGLKGDTRSLDYGSRESERERERGLGSLHFALVVCLEGQGDLVSRLITPITHIITLVIPITNQLTKSP